MTNSSDRPWARQVPPPAGGASSAAAPSHARFIPREELGGFAAWQPGTLDRAAAHSRYAHPQEFVRRPEHSPAVGTPEVPEAPALEAPAEPAIDVEALQAAARQSGYQDGYRDGMAALESFKRSFAQQTMAQVGELLRGIQDQLRTLDSQMADAVVQAALALARQVVRQELRTAPDLVVQVAKDAVAAIGSAASRMELHLHPEDLALVQQGAPELVSRPNLVLVPAPTLSRGGCLLQSAVGSVDAGIDTRWSHALQRMGQKAAAQPLRAEQADQADQAWTDGTAEF